MSRRMEVSLNGVWEQLIGDRHYRRVEVPSSYAPVGLSVLARTLPEIDREPGEQLELVFEGVANGGRWRWGGPILATWCHLPEIGFACRRSEEEMAGEMRCGLR